MRQHAAASEFPTKPYLYTEPKLWQYLVERPSSVGRGGDGFSLVGIVSSHKFLTNEPLSSLSSKQLLFDNSPTPVHHLLHRKLVPAHVSTNFGPRKNLRKLTRSHFGWLSACLIFGLARLATENQRQGCLVVWFPFFLVHFISPLKYCGSSITHHQAQHVVVKRSFFQVFFFFH